MERGCGGDRLLRGVVAAVASSDTRVRFIGSPPHITSTVPVRAPLRPRVPLLTKEPKKKGNDARPLKRGGSEVSLTFYNPDQVSL